MNRIHRSMFHQSRFVLVLFVLGFALLTAMTTGRAQAGDEDGVAGYSMRAKTKYFDSGAGNGAGGSGSAGVEIIRSETDPQVLGVRFEAAQYRGLLAALEMRWLIHMIWLR